MYRPRNYIQSEGDGFVRTVFFLLSLTWTTISLIDDASDSESNVPPLRFGSFEPLELERSLGKSPVDGLDQAVRVVIKSSSADEFVPRAGKSLQF